MRPVAADNVWYSGRIEGVRHGINAVLQFQVHLVRENRHHTPDVSARFLRIRPGPSTKTRRRRSVPKNT